MSKNNQAEVVAKSEQQQGNGQLSNAENAMQLLNTAVENGADTETLEHLMSLQERYQENEARKEFDAAMADLRSDLPTISKNNTVSHKGASYDYEDLSTIVEKVSPAMAEHDLSFRWRTDSEETNEVKVSCVISHRDGHSEETTLSAQPDTSGSKNSIQAIGSTVTYLQRYTLKAALGIAAGPDDDGVSAEQEKPKTNNNVTSDTSNQENHTYPFSGPDGKDLKDKPLSEVPDEDLEWLVNEYLVGDKLEGDFGDKNKELKAAAQGELSSRNDESENEKTSADELEDEKEDLKARIFEVSKDVNWPDDMDRGYIEVIKSTLESNSVDSDSGYDKAALQDVLDYLSECLADNAQPRMDEGELPISPL